ncbi:MAG TPA: hypothetical protein PK725_02495 [Rhodocyclaceae bacterium]|nr:hypothetical protein [Rhodocyclaceae bacterium]
MMRYGFQRLALLNSAGYVRADLPLDAAVSLIAPNNAGKTSLINALQFLLIIDRRRMDFGAHELDTSRRFYFPNNSAYILLEVALPTMGTVVLGCVGKGVSHDYEYFAYKGELNLDDFRLPDGTTVQQPQLKAHMAQLGRLVFSYASAEFADALYGGRRRRDESAPDFTVFKLEQSSHAAVFQKVLTRTLRLDRLNSNEVKAYLLEIFRNDLPDANIDFKAEWDKAFAEVNAERAQYDAAMRQRPRIAQLESDQRQRLILRGKLLHFRPLIDTRLSEWDAFQRNEHASLTKRLADVEAQENRQQERDRELVRNQLEAQGQLKHLDSETTRYAELSRRFELVSAREILEQHLKDARTKYEAQAALVVNASSRSVAAIQRDIDANRKQLQQRKGQLETLTDNLYLRLQETLDKEALDGLNLVFAQQTMTLPPSAFDISTDALRSWLSITDTEAVALPGLRIRLDGLVPQHTQESREQILERLNELETATTDLRHQLEAAQAIDAARASKVALEKRVRDIEREIEAYDELLRLRATQNERSEQIAQLRARIEEIQRQLEGAKDEAQRLRKEHSDIRAQITRLEDQHKQVVQSRNRRNDDAPIFGMLADLPHQVWMGSGEVELSELVDALQTYHQDCRNLIQLDERMQGHLATLHEAGLTKYQFADSPENEIERIIAFAAHLAQEAEALERKARTAVVNVTACLRELRDGLLTFKSKMREFNRLISRRQLSDLSVFKIEPVDETPLVEAIEQLISTAEQAESGETFKLFDHQNVLDDATLNRAKTLLIEEGAARGCLRVEHFFRLEFIVGKTGAAAESFSDIDSAASNGTVLMAKLVTGLALLHQMKDKRHKVQAVCYLDEASALDPRNQRSLIETAEDFGFALIFASPTPLITARYCVPITSREGRNTISRQNWQTIEPLEAAGATG